jgi:hypothetical protein
LEILEDTLYAVQDAVELLRDVVAGLDRSTQGIGSALFTAKTEADAMAGFLDQFVAVTFPNNQRK